MTKRDCQKTKIFTILLKIIPFPNWPQRWIQWGEHTHTAGQILNQFHDPNAREQQRFLSSHYSFSTVVRLRPVFLHRISGKHLPVWSLCQQGESAFSRISKSTVKSHIMLADACRSMLTKRSQKCCKSRLRGNKPAVWQHVPLNNEENRVTSNVIN